MTPGFSRWALGVDLGGTTTGAALIDEHGTLLAHVQQATHAYRPAREIVAEVAGLVRTLLGQAGLEGTPDTPLGVGVPAVLDDSRRRVTLLPNFGPGWYDLDLVALLSEQTGLDTSLINDARAFTLAEATHGAGHGSGSVLGITLGTGVGGGLVQGGRLYHGPRGTAGEFGHQVYDPHGPSCGCGGTGCIEVYASGPALVGAVTRAFRQGRVPLLRELCSGSLEAVTPRLIAQAAAAGEAECRQAYDRAARALAVGIANVSALLGVETAVLGGGVAQAGEVLFGPLAQELTRYAALLGERRPRLALAQLGPQAGAIGAAVWAAQGAGQERPAERSQPP